MEINPIIGLLMLLFVYLFPNKVGRITVSGKNGRQKAGLLNFGFLSLIIIVYAISGRVNSFYIKSICYVVILILISIIVIKAITYEKK